MDERNERREKREGQLIIQMLLSSAFEDPSELRGLSPEVQAQLLSSKSFQFQGAKYGLEAIFVPRGFSVGLAIIQDEKGIAVAYGFSKADDNSPESYMESDRRALERALERAKALLGEISGEKVTYESARSESSELTTAETPKSQPKPQPRTYAKGERRYESSQTYQAYDEVEEPDRGVKEEMRISRSPAYSHRSRREQEEERGELPRINTYQKRFFSLVAKLNWSLDKAKSFLRKHTGKDSTRDVEPEEWNKVLALLEEQLRSSQGEEFEEDEWEEIFK